MKNHQGAAERQRQIAAEKAECQRMLRQIDDALSKATEDFASGGGAITAPEVNLLRRHKREQERKVVALQEEYDELEPFAREENNRSFFEWLNQQRTRIEGARAKARALMEAEAKAHQQWLESRAALVRHNREWSEFVREAQQKEAQHRICLDPSVISAFGASDAAPGAEAIQPPSGYPEATELEAEVGQLVKLVANQNYNGRLKVKPGQEFWVEQSTAEDLTAKFPQRLRRAHEERAGLKQLLQALTSRAA